MKNSDFDDILTTAFDSDHAGGSEEMARLKLVKSDLLKLRTEIPECQLSTERMRDAILSAGIKPKRNYWNWLVPASAVTACLAFVMIFRSGSEAVRGAENIAKVAPPIVETKVHEPVSTGGATEPIVKATRPIPEVDKPPVARNSASRPTGGSKQVAVREKSSAKFSASARGGSANMALAADTGPKAEFDSSATVVATAMGPWDKTEDPGVIVIDTQEDANTGANRASEVATPSDVVISG